MKKVLLGTSAVALACAFATQASANEWTVKVGGYMEQLVAYADSDVTGVQNTEFGGVDPKQDAEIFFLPSLTLDNGLRFSANIQLEAAQAGDQIDESYLIVEGSFGRVLIGSENSAGYLTQISAPDVSLLGANDGDIGAFMPLDGAVNGINVGDTSGTLSATFIENGQPGGAGQNGNNDAQRLTYFTPRFAGFQVGLSYARDDQQDNNAQVDLNTNQLNNIFDVGANYQNSFGDFDVALSARWGIASNDSVNPGLSPEIYGFGANFGYAGVTIGGSFVEQNESGISDGTAWDVGISYETGPWGVSFTYFTGENVDDENAANVLGNDENLDVFVLGVDYELAKGVRLNAFGSYADLQEDRGDNNAAQGNDVDGFVIGTGVRIAF